VVGREKHLYSIYQKMKTKRKSLSEILDVYAFRIVCDNVDACYRVLGVIHGLYKPVHGEFKDYIAIPKANGYQSLHTVMIGMHGLPVEVQIRTDDMEHMANSGIAAHWLYKSDSAQGSSTNSNQVRAREWVKGLLDIQRSAGNPMEFIEHVKVDLFPDEVYVFTPNGKIVELPVGATAVDFAYAVHTDIGNTCVACRVNRRLAPLSQPLESGQTVTIVTAPAAQPNPAWLNFVKTGKARSSIRHFLKTQRHAESIELGKRLLNKALVGLGTNFDALEPEQVQLLLQDFEDDKTFEDVLEDIGLGNQVSFLIAKRLVQREGDEQVDWEEDSDSPLMIDTAEGQIISFAKCCHPIPGDPILGHMSPGRGIVVHVDSCKNIAEYRDNPQKVMSLNWSPVFEGEFTVDLRVEVENERGIIAVLANKITEAEANIEKVSIAEKDAGYNVVILTVSVRNRIHLANVMRRVRTLRQVIKTTRMKN
jgi:guanosine-3',5'-bis(diphosphate) 3'-pyrophosphohydrolase